MIRSEQKAPESHVLYSLIDPYGGEILEVLSPPEVITYLPEESPVFSKQSLSPWLPWYMNHEALELSEISNDSFSALYSGRISPEPYQFAPVRRMLQLPRPRLLIADDVGLGKTIEAGICMLELISRGKGKRVLLIVPPGLIPQWQDEMMEKFGLEFRSIENAASLEQAQTSISEGVKPWIFYDKVITSTEYIKKREVINNVLGISWDLIIVDEAHYLAESGTPKNPYFTARTRLGHKVRENSYGLILLTAIPHNGYSHSFRSLLELVEPTDATFEGDKEIIRRRVSRNMIRRLKPQIYKSATDGRKPAFPPREPVRQIAVKELNDIEREIFIKVSSYCSKATKAAQDTEDKDLVSFAMQIIKKRMLSSRKALAITVANRLEALKSDRYKEEPPPRSEINELQGDLPLGEALHERISNRIVRAAIPKEERRRKLEKKQLTEILGLLNNVKDVPDPKISTLIADLRDKILGAEDEKAIIFTEYRDTLNDIKETFDKDERLKGCYTELTGGMTKRQRQSCIAQFEKSEIKFLIATDAASEGLNLQFHCRRLYHVELPWNPNRMEQRNGRIDRYGQTRNPVISYLYYPNSPEDDVLMRLVKRILEMQDDRVSTPDILGIVSGINIDEEIVAIDAEVAGKNGETRLFKLIDENRDVFAKNIAPLIKPDDGSHDEEVYSADPMISNDVDFEDFFLNYFGNSLKKGLIEHTYSLATPNDLKGPLVKDKYDCLTLRRSVAVQYPSSEVEFINRIHPLFKAIAKKAYETLTASHSANVTSKRLCVRRNKDVKEPFAVFTFALSTSGKPTKLLKVPLDIKGKSLDEKYAQLVTDRTEPADEVEWGIVESVFKGRFNELQTAAQKILQERISQIGAHELERRKKLALILREDAEKYRADRLKEIDKEENEAKTILDANRQMLMFMDRTVSGFKAKRAAIETFHDKRMKEINEFEKGEGNPDRQPLGAIFVFPKE